MKYISVVIPVYNEQENAKLLYEELVIVLRKLGDYEIIFIDDGSKDNSFRELEKLHKKDHKVKVIKFVSCDEDYNNMNLTLVKKKTIKWNESLNIHPNIHPSVSLRQIPCGYEFSFFDNIDDEICNYN